MGGIGSGRPETRPKVERLRRLDIGALARAGYLQDGVRGGWRWRRHGEPDAVIGIVGGRAWIRLIYRQRRPGEDWRIMDRDVWIERTPCRYGGERPWFLCPACGGRRRHLYFGGAGAACRKCLGLAYASQAADEAGRACLRRDRLRARLEAAAGGDDALPERPKGMHERTWRRLVEDWIDADMEADQRLGEVMERLFERHGGDPR